MNQLLTIVACTSPSFVVGVLLLFAREKLWEMHRRLENNYGVKILDDRKKDFHAVMIAWGVMSLLISMASIITVVDELF